MNWSPINDDDGNKVGEIRTYDSGGGGWRCTVAGCDQGDRAHDLMGALVALNRHVARVHGLTGV